MSDSTFSLTRSFNGFGEINAYDLSISGSNVFSLTLARNDNGEITGKTETIEGTTTEIDYTYDEKGQLLTVITGGTLVEEYQYDNNGNRTYEMNSLRGIAGRTLGYSDEDHIVTAGTVQYAFDSDDRLSSRTDGSETTDYVYSSTGELMRVALPDGKAITYTNDSTGRRIAKSVNGTVEEKYLWSGLTTLLAVYDGSGNLYQRFIYADGRMPYAMEMNGSTYYLTYDQVGSLRLVTDSAGNTVKRIDYDTFGNVISDSNESFTVPFGFAGGLHDRDTDLVRFGYRDYMPEIGKWTAKDPILFAGGDTNLYGYVLNDPVNFIDPLGLQGRAGHMSWMSNAMSVNYRSPGPARKIPRPPKAALDSLSNYSPVFMAYSAASGNAPAALVFAGIAGGAEAAKVCLYSDDKTKDTVKAGVKMVNPSPYPLNIETDKWIENAVDNAFMIYNGEMDYNSNLNDKQNSIYNIR